jgi:hypothetical protein
MNLSEYIYVTSRPYSSLLQEISISGKLFSSKQLAFTMQMQTQSNWCWAATSTSVSHFYWFWSTWTQCRVANGELAHSDCCDSPVPSACNVPWYLDKALTRTHNFVSIIGQQASFRQVREEIDAGRLVCARIGWNGGGGHFMVIYGYSRFLGMEYFDIDDPIYGKSHLAVSDFANNYQGSGTWTHTYFTKSYFKMPIKYLLLAEPILQRIREARPLLKLKQGSQTTQTASEPRLSHDFAEDSHAAVGMAHRIFSVGLDALLGRNELAPQSVGLRVYESVGQKLTAFFDVSEEEQPRLLQMSAAGEPLELFTRGLAEVLEALGRNDPEAELRLLRVPALNFEALWISYEGKSDDKPEDMLVPLRAVGSLVPDKPVPLREALPALKEAARPLVNMDDAMGA